MLLSYTVSSKHFILGIRVSITCISFSSLDYTLTKLDEKLLESRNTVSLTLNNTKLIITICDFPGSTMAKNLPANARDMGSILVREDPTCHGATKPMHHNYWACALEPASHNCWACVPQLLKPVRPESMLRSKRSQHSEKLMHHNKE